MLDGILKCSTRYQIKTERLREHLLNELAELNKRVESKQDSRFMLEEVRLLPLEPPEERKATSLKRLYEDISFLSSLTDIIRNKLKKG